MAHIIRGRSQKKGNYKIVLLNPAEKAKRYARQMKAGKVVETGENLSATDMAYRAGYLDSRNDSAKAYNANHGNRKSRKK